jgi:hypothetical protein
MTYRYSKSRAFAAPVWLVVTLLAVAPMESLAQDKPPTNYVQSNTGLGGFADGAGVRLRTEKKRGIKAGDFLLWPSLVMEGRWDSNLFQADKEDGAGPISTPVLRIIPGIGVSNPNPGKVSVNFGAETDIRLYLSDDKRVTEQRNFAAKADLRLDILPKSPVSFTVFDSFRRTLHTRNFASLESYNMNTNRAGAILSVHPGGRALDMSLGYAFSFNKFDDFEKFDSNFQELKFLTSWRFYPKTLALLEVTGQLRDWNTGSDEGNFAVNDKSFVDSKPLRAMVGLNGFISKRVAALLKVGYGHSFHNDGPDFEHVIGHGELAFKLTTNFLVAVGIQRDFEDSFYGNYYVENRSYLRLQARIAQRVGIELYADYRLVDFAEYDPAIPGVFISHVERRDQPVSGHAKVDVDITRWIGLSLGYEIEANFTKYRILHTLSNGTKSPDVGRFIRHQVYGSVNVQY